MYVVRCVFPTRVSQRRVPYAAPVHARRRSRIPGDRIRGIPLAENSELRAILVHANVRAAHAALPIERGSPMQHTVVVHDCEGR